MTIDEQKLVTSTPFGETASALGPSTDAAPPGANARWHEIQAKRGAVACPSIDELMKMIGLEAVKENMIELETCDMCRVFWIRKCRDQSLGTNYCDSAVKSGCS